MIVVSVASAALLAVMLMVALINLVTAPRLESATRSPHPRRVSVLVPARDEAANLAALLPALLALDHPGLQILVLDDGSSDDTAAIVRAHAHGSAGRLRLLNGAQLPPGWLGKSWACQQLADATDGEVIIFCDADVLPCPGAVALTLAAMQDHSADVLTALPRQRFFSLSDAAVVPLVAQLPVLALLPLALVPRTRPASLSMANGQWLAFTRDAYRATGGHAAVRGEVLEDVALGRRAKAAGQRLLPVVASDAVEVRMYRDAASLREGFRKNLYPLAGGRPAWFALTLAGFLLTAVYPWVGAVAGAPGALLPLCLLLVVRVLGAVLFRTPLASILLHPPGSLAVLAIAVGSARATAASSASWKGRVLRTPTDR